jgi:hypothetical protein
LTDLQPGLCHFFELSVRLFLLAPVVIWRNWAKLYGSLFELHGVVEGLYSGTGRDLCVVQTIAGRLYCRRFAAMALYSSMARFVAATSISGVSVPLNSA